MRGHYVLTFDFTSYYSEIIVMRILSRWAPAHLQKLVHDQRSFVLPV